MTLLNVIQLKPFIANRFPNRRQIRKHFEVYMNLRDTGLFKELVSDNGRPINIRTVNIRIVKNGF